MRVSFATILPASCRKRCSTTWTTSGRPASLLLAGTSLMGDTPVAAPARPTRTRVSSVSTRADWTPPSMEVEGSKFNGDCTAGSLRTASALPLHAGQPFDPPHLDSPLVIEDRAAFGQRHRFLEVLG